MSSLSLDPEFVVDAAGKRKSVILSLSQYEGILRRLEELEDALALDEARQAPGEFRDYAEIRAELQKSGRL